MTWTYQGQPLTEEQTEGYFGFTYRITQIATGKAYLGRKALTKAKTLKPLKGKVRKRRSRVKSDWEDYWGSSEALLAEIEHDGKDGYVREVLRLCKTKAECSYYEAKAI